MGSSIGLAPGLSRHLHRSAVPRFHAYSRSIAIPSSTSSDNNSSSMKSGMQYRPFSQSMAPRIKARAMASTMDIKRQPERSLKSRIRDMPLPSLPTDLGLLPGTFVKPEGKDMPSIFKEPRERLRFEWVWVKTWVQNVIATVAYHKYFFKGLPLELKNRKTVAKNLYSAMYTEFARGNDSAIRDICCDGLANNLIRRIKSRVKGEKVSWNLLHYNRTPSTFFTGVRVLSDRATKIPELPDSGVRQVVVRISSKQSTVSYSQWESEDGEPGAIVPGLEKEQDCTEYLVIQKLRINGEDREWRIWGYTKPTTVDELDSPWFSSELSMKDRLEMMQDMMQGKK